MSQTGLFTEKMIHSMPVRQSLGAGGKIENCALKIILAVLLFSFLPVFADAATIGRPANNLGLVGYWDFEVGKGGDTAYDRSGLGNNGTINNATGSVNWVDGVIGQGFEFDGVDDYVNIPDPPLESVDEFTVTFWINPNPNSTPADYFGKWNGWSNPTDSKQVLFRNNIDFFVRNASDSAEAEANHAVGAQLNTSEWNFVAGVADGSEIKVAVNGVFGNPTSFAGPYIPSSSDGWAIGRAHNELTNASIDDVRIYNRALSPGEVERLYKLGQQGGQKIVAAPAGVKSGLIGYWPFDGSSVSGSVVSDMSGNGHTGTLRNAAAVHSDGKFNESIEFINGGRGNVLVGNMTDHFANEEATFCAWLKRRVHSSGDEGSWFFNASNDNNHYVWGSTIYDGSFKTTRETVGSGIVSDRTTWHFVCITRKAGPGGWKFYQNAQVIHSASGGTWQMASSVKLGQSNSSIYGFDGRIDEARLYNRALTQNEIKQLYRYDPTKTVTLGSSHTNRLTDDLVGHWTFDGDVTNASTTSDVSGNGNNGTLTNGPVPAIGKLGQALEFDGVDDYVQLNAEDFDGSQMTISAWVQFDSQGAFEQIIGTWTGSGSDAAWALGSYWNAHSCTSLTTGMYFQLYGANGLAYVVSTENDIVNDGEWHHIVGVREANRTIKIYIDGASEPLTTCTNTGSIDDMTEPGDPIEIGARTSTKGHVDGKIDSVRVYDRALSADEVYELYNVER